ncbi:glycerate kinase [Cohnella sp. NL03-T5]|nr:glycerate kinase [Cohnella silvisoli]
MRVVAAPDSFKGSLSAKDAARAMERGVLSACADAVVVRKPIADGGEGTVDAVLEAVPEGLRLRAAVSGPLNAALEAEYAMLPDGTAVFELAAASGLTLLPAEDLRPLEASTHGTGELIRAALDRGCRQIVIGLGGSATTDGGTGLLRALGCRFLDASGDELGPGGAELLRLDRIDRTGLHPRLAEVAVTLCCDVTNPLCGPEGAAAVYGPQKGADTRQVAQLDHALERFADVLEATTGSDEYRSLPGGGAAGGTGAGLAALLGAALKPGFGLLAELTNLEAAIAGADLVLTGEGRTDNQTLNGKVPVGVARLARRCGVPVVVLSGGIGPGAEGLYGERITAIFGLPDKPMELREAMNGAEALLERAAGNVARLFAAGQSR